MSLRSLLESFEPRRMMSVVPVTNLNDTGAGSLRAAISAAVDGDTIDLSRVSGTVTLTGQIDLAKSLTLQGNDQATTVISGGNANRIFAVANGAKLALRDLTLAGGTCADSGGAILNHGTCVLHDVTVKNCTAAISGGGIYSDGTSLSLDDSTVWGDIVQGTASACGGGIYVKGGTLNVANCTFSQNKAVGVSNAALGTASGVAKGGALCLDSTAASTIRNSTFGANTCHGGTTGPLNLNGAAYGGAIYTYTTTATLLDHDTLAYNTAAGGGIAATSTLAASSGGGVYCVTNTVGVTLRNSIVAKNTAADQPDVISTLVNTLGSNVVGVYSGTLLHQGVLGDLLGSAVSPLDPGLSSTLADNGGPTLTYSLVAASPAVNAADSTSPTCDQRGLFRRDLPDVGAFELNSDHAPAIATVTGSAVADATYRQPIACVDGDGDPVTVTSPDLPSWLKIKTVGGVPTLVGKPTELNASAPAIIHLVASDGYASTAETVKVKVQIPGIDLSDSGLLRLNGTEFNDVLSIGLIKGGTVRVFRDGFKRNFPLSAVKKVQVFGFGGDDAITIGVGTVSASVNAGAGNDTVDCGGGNDYISGEGGNDRIDCGGGKDRCDGGAGNDRINGGDGNDVLHGGSGRDVIDGGTGTNHLFGDDGDDTLVGLLGRRDVLDGGGGSNTGDWNKTDHVSDDVLLDASLAQ